MAQTWRSLTQSACAQMPFDAVKGGHDVDGSPIYVGRAKHERDMLPAKVVPCKGGAYVSHGGKEHFKTNFDILVGQGYAWVSASNGFVPANAVIGGSSGCEQLYIGRGMHSNSLCVGKIHRSHCCLYIPFGGLEITLKSYEVLVYRAEDKWVHQPKSCNIVPGALVAGHRAGDNAPIFVARAMHNDVMVPGKFIPSKKAAYIGYGGKEHQKTTCEVLCGEGYIWISHNNHCIPSNAVSGGNSLSGEPLYIGRGHYEGSVTPGVISQSQRCLLIPYFGREIQIHNYEILCRN